jgi:hypothetical protein
MQLLDLVHFTDFGWCILAEVIETDAGIAYQFFTLEFFNGKPREFSIRKPEKEFGTQPPDKCKVRYSNERDFKNINNGEMIFYFVNDFYITGKWAHGKIRFGRITDIDRAAENIVIDNLLTVKPFNLLAYEHNFEEIKDTAAFICEHCRALKTPKS